MDERRARRSFWLALAVSLMLHLAAATVPGWDLPEDDTEAAILAATLAPTPVAGPAPLPRKKLSPRPKSAAPLPEATPESASETVQETVVAEPSPPEPEAPPEPAADAVPPAPTSDPMSPAPPLTGRLPPAGRIVYQVARGDGFVVGTGEHRWRHDGVRYELRAVVETTGLAALFRAVKVVQESRGIFDAQGLRPLAFDSWRDGTLKESVRFEPEQGRIALSKGRSADYVPAVQDLLSIFYQLGLAPADAQRFAMSVATGRKVATYSVTVTPVAPPDLPQGVREARAYAISAGTDGDVTEVWLDTETRLPVRIRHKDRKGEVFVQLATLIELEPTP